MKKSSSFNALLLNEGSLQNRWKKNGASFIPRIRKNKFRINFIYLIAVILVVLIVYITLPATRNFSSYRHINTSPQVLTNEIVISNNYNSVYPLSKSILNSHQKTQTFKIGLIADLDTNSKRNSKKDEFSSFFMTGFVTISSIHTTFEFKWDSEVKEIISGYSLKGKLIYYSRAVQILIIFFIAVYLHYFLGRGMELSELVTFNGKLLTFDDRTGIVFEIDSNASTLSPWVILTDGETISQKGFKSEWATVKNAQLFVGSMGKEWTDAGGNFQNVNPMMVKVINVNGEVKTLNWVKNFKALRSAIGIEWPGI